MMLSFTRYTLAAGLILLFSCPLLAQKVPAPPIQLGSVTKADFDASPAAADSATAVAEYLCDYGTTKLVGANAQFKVVFERTARLRIHKKEGYEYATVRVPLYTRDGEFERLSNLKGFTYNLIDGKPVATKLVADPQVAREKLDKNHLLYSFTMPNVREGSIIEFSYLITSDFMFNLQDWQFEHPIPVRWSEYRATIPQFFIYKTITRGYLPFALKESSTVPYATSYFSAQNGLAPSQDLHISAQALQLRWAMKDVPAFREEPFMTTAHDYLRSIHFELGGTHFPGQDYHDMTGQWAGVWRLLQQDENFGLALGATGPLATEAQQLKARYPTDLAARATAVLGLVQRSMRYSGQSSVYTSQPLRRSLEHHAGNAADVNLLLVQTLRDAGLDATPLLISTRSHGRVQTDLPVITQFNYVAAHLALPNGSGALLDATEPQLPFGLLPERCLNGQGCLANASGTWVPLTAAASHTEYQQAQLQLTADGTLQGTSRLEYTGYAGLSARRQIRQSSGGAYLATVKRRWDEWQPTNLQLLHTDSAKRPLTVQMDLSHPTENPQATTLYLPLLRNALPVLFRSQDRRYPVSLGMPHEYTSVVTLVLPAGYEVQEIPTALVLALPDNGGRFYYQASQTGPEKIQLTMRLRLNKAEYGPEEYASLREFHQRATAKCAELLVVRRK